MPITDPRHRRSYLFVPANWPERLPKAEPRDVRLCAGVLDDAGLPGKIGAPAESCAGLDAARDTARAAAEA